VSEQERNKQIVRRAIDEVINGGRMELVDELYAPEIAASVKEWIAPFRASFPDVQMDTIDLVAEGDKVVGRFTCSGTHEGEWRGHPPTGRRFERVDEVYFFRLRDGRITESWGVEDTADRLRQLGLSLA
jgi:predicted ester cyclase